MEIDKFDARLLSILQKDNRVRSELLGEQVGLSATACQRRLRRLRSSGTIEADISIVSPKAAGNNVQVLALVTLEHERSGIINRFKKAIRTTPEVVNGFYVTGDFDYVLYITARDTLDYERFIQQFFDENPDVKAFKTMMITGRVKIGFALPISADPPKRQ